MFTMKQKLPSKCCNARSKEKKTPFNELLKTHIQVTICFRYHMIIRELKEMIITLDIHLK